MEKHAVNLIIKRSTESPLFVKLKIWLPLTAVFALTIFVLSFLASIIYISNNNNEFNALKLQVESLEKRIAGNKNIEGIYTLTVLRLKTITQLGAGSKNYASLLESVLKLQTTGITISQTTVDKKNAVTIAVTASSSAALDGFVTTLLVKDAAKLFSNIRSSGIVRDKTGNYLLSVSLTPNPDLLQ